MKKLGFTCIALAAGFLFTNAYAQVEKPKKELVEISANDSTVKLRQGTVVPASQTYNVYDENGILLGTYTAGKTVIVPASKGKKKVDCFVVKCPKTFGKNTTCWKCR